jgi:hypothetical protein
MPLRFVSSRAPWPTIPNKLLAFARSAKRQSVLMQCKHTNNGDSRFGSKTAAELRGRRRQVLLSKQTPKIRFPEKFCGDRQNRPRRKPAGALFRGDSYLSTPTIQSLEIVQRLTL